MRFASLPQTRRIARFILPLALLSVPLPAWAAEEPISAEARAYFRNGVELLQSNQPNYQDAYYQFKLAHDKSKSWKVLGNLGLCALKLERDSEALAYYEEYLRRGGKEIAKEEREAIERDMLLVRGNGATVELTSSVPDLEIRDVRMGASLGPQTHQLSQGKKQLFLRAGTHELTAIARSGETLTWSVVLEPGQTVSHEFDFHAPQAASAAPASAPATTETALSSPSEPTTVAMEPRRAFPLRTVGFVTLGAGVLALGGGVVTGLMAKSKESEAKDMCDSSNVCQLEAEDLFDQSDSLARTTNIFLIAGGAVTAVGLGLVIFGGPSQNAPTTSSIQVFPLIGPSAGGVWANARF